jgi:hypothetical protein
MPTPRRQSVLRLAGLNSHWQLFVKRALYEQLSRSGWDFHGKINTAARAANHRKSNSYATPSPECRVAHPRAPDDNRRQRTRKEIILPLPQADYTTKYSSDRKQPVLLDRSARGTSLKKIAQMKKSPPNRWRGSFDILEPNFFRLDWRPVGQFPHGRRSLSCLGGGKLGPQISRRSLAT